MTQVDEAGVAQRRELESFAVQLAQLAGDELIAASSKPFAVDYKDREDATRAYRDPVSEVDRRCELLLRERIAAHYPHHDVIGEESDARPARESSYAWALDPIDGTANFVNGFPTFCSSIGLLHDGVPIAGAIWCATTHALRPGIYHAHRGGELHFEGESLAPRRHAGVRRFLAGVTNGGWTRDLPWDGRVTGAAALECAFTAAGLLRVSYMRTTKLWDVAAGVCLVQAGGGTVRVRKPDGWQSFERFSGAGKDGSPDLRHWRETLVLGERSAVQTYCEHLFPNE